jgi:hypothetical protein
MSRPPIDRPLMDRPPTDRLPMDRPPMDRPPMDQPPQQLYDRGPEQRRRSPPPRLALYDGRPPSSRAHTFPMQNNNFDPRGPPPSRGYDQGPPPSRGYEFDPRYDERGYNPDPRRNPRNGNADQMLDNYLEELGSPGEPRFPPSRQDPRVDPKTDARTDPRADLRADPRVDPRSDLRMDPRNDPRIDPRNDRRMDRRSDPRMDPSRIDQRSDPRYDPRQPPGMDPRFDRRAPLDSGSAESEPYVPPDRRQLAAQVGLAGPPPPSLLPRSQTVPDLDLGVQRMDIRRNSPPNPTSDTRPRSPNKLHKAPKNSGPIGVQPQIVSMSNGNKIDPNALPIFPSPKSGKESEQRQNSERGSYSSEGTIRGPPRVEKPKLTLALLDERRREAKDNPSNPVIQLEFAKSLLEASTVLSHEQGMGDPKRVAKARENYISEAFKIIRKLSSSVHFLHRVRLINRDRQGWANPLIQKPCFSLLHVMEKD